ncbi:MAG TPA: I78 family peptidase inhibitor [Sphingomicrobium sp.]|jgi:hypothetical protein|nr:I78 family peptidase inhibitor [Sphingomicrobium sp.]
MRKALGLFPILLCACSTLPADPPVHGVTPGHKCEAEGMSRFIGKLGSGEIGAAIMRASHAAVLRWAPPDVMLTMDYREDRVTVYLGPDKKVNAIKCG